MNDFLLTDITFLKGVGPSRAELLGKELGIKTFMDLLYHFPFRYVDKSQFHRIADIGSDQVHVQIKGQITSLDTIAKGKASRLVGSFTDGSGLMELVWFKGLKWISTSLKPNTTYIIYGKPAWYNGKWSITHPEITEAGKIDPTLALNTMQPVYSSTEKLSAKGLNSKGIEKLLATLVPQALNHLSEFIPIEICERYKLPTLKAAMQEIHFPQEADRLNRAVMRFKFEEFLLPQLQVVSHKLQHQHTTRGFVFQQVGPHFTDFYQKYLPFELTNAQKRVLKEIRRDVKTGSQMNRLLQGDVGSGKTAVALMTMLMAKDNGFQSALVAPTEILAQQHFNGLSELLAPTALQIGLLTGSTKQKDRKVLHAKLQSGELDFLVGTHAILEPTVKFKNLGLAIVDEQHRFGVAQRAQLWKKNSTPPHILVMTATPIPRTLAMTVYGDLEISVIDELPPGRKPIKTIHYTDAKRLAVFGFMKEQIKLGRQIYVVYPLINESEAMDYKDLMDGYESICRDFPAPDYQISIVHGQMKSEDKDQEMQRFVQGKTQIMVATTVIEVGVNVPNASVMVIESAERFGLSQLHQLRGRVGRGAEQSYCILMSAEKISREAHRRLQTMVATNDGFKIAEVDLEMRGPGDLMGTQQSGMLEFKLADLQRDQAILKAARKTANEILQADPNLQAQVNRNLGFVFQQYAKKRPLWSKIS